MTTIDSTPIRIQQDAAKLSVNPAATPSAPLLFSYDTHESLSAVQAPVNSTPKSFYARVVDWFKMKIYGEDPQTERIDEPAVLDASPTLPLEKPAQITDDMLNNFVKDLEKLLHKSRNVENEKEELFADHPDATDSIHKILIQVLQKRHKAINEERKISAETLLQNTQDQVTLQKKQKTLNENISSVNQTQIFWTRVNWGASAACVLLSVAGIAANPNALTGILQTAAALSSGGSSMINASMKYSSNKLSGEFISLKDNVEQNKERIDFDMRFFHESHLALTRVYKNLKRIVDGQHQASRSINRF